MYCHNGSGNHGCEAIIRSTVGILSRVGTMQYYQITRNPAEDRKYGVQNLVNLLPEYADVPHAGKEFYCAYLTQKLFHKTARMDYLSSRVSFCVPKGETVSLSIGGDNYCYKGYKLYTGYHQISIQQGHKTVLWGCSVEPQFLEYEDLLEDLKTFDKIIVRERISYQAMYNKGLRNLALYPDPAFTLQPDPMATVFPPENTVGINISPMALSYGSENSKVLGNYEELIRYILSETDMNVALIPHVIWSANDDRLVLQKLQEQFSDNDRVILVEDMDATKLKAYISKLRFLVAARTHASIAAYSTGVPTLVAGYSVKSRGIATDIFGTAEHYVVSVAQMTDIHEFTEAFQWIMAHEQEIRSHLKEFMPAYIEKAYAAGEEIAALFSYNPSELLQTGIRKDSCVGCSACVNACPADCLHMKADEEGFLYPEIDAAHCIHCGLCANVCPIHKAPLISSPIVCEAAKNRNDLLRLSSSSGGVFCVLAEQILRENGVVYGAALDEKCSVHHIEIHNVGQIYKLQGAKYSQSVIGRTFSQAKAHLDAGKKVLFSGTPCQIAGLRSYLKKEYKNLICVDMICHGVPSPLVWEKYLQEMGPGKIPSKVNFRSKDTGWSRYRYALKAEYGDGSQFLQENSENAFLQGMVQDLYLRPSCTDCKFKGLSHQGDLTLGDFWGVWNQVPQFDDNQGVSAVIVNTQAGAALLMACEEKLEHMEVRLEQIVAENPSWIRSARFSSDRAVFYDAFRKSGCVTKAIQDVQSLQIRQKTFLDFLSTMKHAILRR